MKCIVTGGSAGLGQALSRLMVNAGHDVLAVGRRRDEAIGHTPMGADTGTSGSYRYLQADLTTAAGVVLVVEAAAPWRRVDRLVHNAAMGKVAEIEAHSRADVDDQIALNLTAPMALTHGLLDQVAAARGQIVFVSSTAVRRRRPLFPVYTASKAAVEAFARNLRTESNGKITITVHRPGPMRTDFHARAGMKPGPLHRLFTPPEREAARLARRMGIRRRAA